MTSEILEIDGFSLRGMGVSAATRTGRYSLPARRGDNLILAGASGSIFVNNKPWEEGVGALNLWAVGATSGEVVDATNYVLDPTFYSGTSGFTATSGSLARDATHVRLSTYALKVTNAAGVYADVTLPGNTLAPNSPYTFSAWVYTPVGNGGSKPRIRVLGGPFVAAPYSDYASVTNDWEKLIVTGWTGADVSGVTTLRLYGSDAGTEAVWFDDLSFVNGTLAYNFSGDTTGTDSVKYRWVGSPRASYSQRYQPDAYIIPDTFEGQRAQFEANMASVMRLFTHPHRLSTIRAAQPDGTIRRALVEWREWSEPEVQAGGTRAEWSIAYTIPGVWWEDELLTQQSAVAGSDLPKVLDLTSFTGMTGIIEDAVLVVTGPITNPRITEEETGSWVQYAGTLSSGQTWTLDVGAATSTVGGLTVLTKTAHAGNYKFLVIPNEYALTPTPRLSLTGSGGGVATNLTVSARRKWVAG